MCSQNRCAGGGRPSQTHVGIGRNIRVSCRCFEDKQRARESFKAVSDDVIENIANLPNEITKQKNGETDDDYLERWQDAREPTFLSAVKTLIPTRGVKWLRPELTIRHKHSNCVATLTPNGRMRVTGATDEDIVRTHIQTKCPQVSPEPIETSGEEVYALCSL